MKRFLAMIIAVLFVLTSAAVPAVAEDDAMYNPDDPIQIVDGAGRKVSFPAAPATIATSWGGTVDPFFFAMGLSDSLVATNAHNDFHKAILGGMDNIVSVGRWSLDAEALAQLAPDVFFHAAPVPQYLAAANTVKVRAVGLAFNSFDDINGNLRLLGQIFDINDRAEFVIGKSEAVLDIVRERTTALPEDQKFRVVMLGDGTGTLSSDNCNAVEAMIALAGGISLTPPEVARGSQLVNVGVETIFSWDPDVIVIQDAFCGISAEDLLNDPVCAPLTAVQTKRVFVLPGNIDSWYTATPSCCLGVLYMSMQMYPELFEDIDFTEIAVQYYRDVYNLDVKPEDIGL